MSAVLLHSPEPVAARKVSIRYFNLYRVLVASAFVIFGGIFSFGREAPGLFLVTVVAYWLMACSFFLLHAGSQAYAERTLGWQVGIDIVMLGLFMVASGGFRSGVPFLMMTSIAGAGLIGQGRMVMGAAALATLTVLADQLWRVNFARSVEVDFSQAAIIGVGFFAVAIVARMLARRALANEALALARGADLERQIQVNARIIEELQDGVLVIDRDGLVRQFNPRAQELLESPLQLGVALFEQSPALAACRLEEGDCVLKLAPAGKTLHARWARIGDSGDAVLYLEDMDRIQARAQQLKLAALGRLTANIAHEIRNPLSSVSHASELLLEEKRHAMQERLVRIIRDNSARIERIVRDVLELGRRDRLTSESLALDVFCQGFLEEFVLRGSAQQGRVKLEAISVTVRFDRLHLYQILSNLLGNAVRYASDAEGAVQLSISFLDAQCVCLSVRDDGPGIPEADRGNVFEPFFTSDPKGTGLGLFTARELAEANGAELRLVGASGGAEFQLIMRRVA